MSSNEPGPPPRIVSLVPSLTETLLAWGVEPAGVTRFCEVEGYPLVGGTKNPDIDAIVALTPDAVLMDREENRRADAEALQEAGLRVVAVHVRSVGDVEGALARVAEVVGRRPDGSQNGGSQNHGSQNGGPQNGGPQNGGPRRDGAQQGGAPGPGPERIPVWVPIWRRPWMTIGADTYGSSILAAAGFDNVYAGAPDPYPTVDLDAARARGPAFVLAPSEPYPFRQKHRRELEQVAPTVFVDGRDLFWWGSRTPAAQRRLAQLAAGLTGR